MLLCIGDGFGEAFIIEWLIIELWVIMACGEAEGFAVDIIWSATANPPVSTENAMARGNGTHGHGQTSKKSC